MLTSFRFFHKIISRAAEMRFFSIDTIVFNVAAKFDGVYHFALTMSQFTFVSMCIINVAAFKL